MAGTQGAHTASVGQTAARTLVAAVIADCRWQALHEYRHRSRALTAASTPLPQRYLNDWWGLSKGFNDPGGHRPSQSRVEGDFIKLMLSLLIHEMKIQKYMDRMSHPPLQATSLDELHSNNWSRFAGWTTMTFNEQTNCLRTFLLFKFSMDQDMHCMMPAIGVKRKHRNNAQWIGFWLTDAEMERLVADVMRQYTQATEPMIQPTQAQ
jgi:hypothetical protein